MKRSVLPLVFLALIVTLTACGGRNSAETSSPVFEEEPYNQSPMLTNLPPAEQRLPINPMIVKPVESTGKYGGIWRMGLKNVKDTGFFVRIFAYENLVRWDPEWLTVIPNIAEAFDVEDESTVFTFHLREGMKWSDGADFTADDILFAWDCMQNRELYPQGVPAFLLHDSEHPEVSRLDDYSVEFRFSAPHGFFLQNLALPEGRMLTEFPAHYLKPLHKDYNETIEEKVQPLIDNGTYDSWAHYFNFQRRYTINCKRPTLHAWVLESNYTDLKSGDILKAVRNPYYWKIDTEYNQLPYIDELEFTVFESNDEVIHQALSGRIDMQERHISNIDLRADFEKIADLHNYSFFGRIPSQSNMMIIDLNLVHDDPVKRRLYNDKKFRIALSLAIDRNRIIDEVYSGLGIPYQAAPRPESPYFSNEFAYQFTEYNPEEASAILDSAGYPLHSDGLRRNPEGSIISLKIECADLFSGKWPEVLEIVSENWRAVGIETVIELKNWSELDVSRNNSLHDVLVWTGTGGLDVVLTPHNYLPASSEAGYGMKWVQWFTGDERFPKDEPPETVKRQLDLYAELKSTADPAIQRTIMSEIIEIAQQQFYRIGISLPPEGFGILKKNFRNVPSVMPDAWTYPSPAPTNPCQYYFDR